MCEVTAVKILTIILEMLRDKLLLFESWEPSKYKYRECAIVLLTI